MNLLLCSMTVPWPSRPSQGAYHISQAHALVAQGCSTSVLSPAPLLPAWSARLGEPFRRHLATPDFYHIRDVPVLSPQIPFAFPGVARRHLAASCPRLLSNLAARALRPAVLAGCTKTHAHAILAHGVLPWGDACTQASIRLGINLCFIEHSAEDVLRLRRGTRLGEHYRQIASRARRVLVVGEPMRAHLTEHLGLTNVEWIPNGVDTLDLDSPPEAPRKRIVLAAGHYYRRKRFEELVECWPKVRQQHPDAHLAIVTNAPESLRSLIHQRGQADAISLRPLLPAPALRREMADATLFALPSRDEAFGLVYAEALSVGTPVLMANDCGLASLVGSPDEPLGWVTDPKDQESLARCMTSALSQPHLCRQMGSTGRRIVRQRFTWQANADAVLRAFGSCGVRA